MSEASCGRGKPVWWGCPCAPWFGEVMQRQSCAWRPAWHSLACPAATRCGVGGAAAFWEGYTGLSIRYWGLLVRCEMSGRVVSKTLSYLVVTLSGRDS